jgi:hypothetical protein
MSLGMVQMTPKRMRKLHARPLRILSPIHAERTGYVVG